MAKWYNSFVIVPKPNGTVYPCMYPMTQPGINKTSSERTINKLYAPQTNKCTLYDHN